MEIEEISNSLNIKKEDLLGQWEAQESDVEESTMMKRKGSLLLTKDEFIFVAKVGVFSKKLKECWRIPLLAIKSARKMPFPIRAVIIPYNVAPEKAGFLRKFVGMPQLAFKIKDSKSFIEKLKELNPKIK